MSADNWTQCPRCKARHEKAAEARRSEVQALCGEVPVEEFEQRRAELAEFEGKQFAETLREDYEIYGAEDGVVKVSYGCSCAICNLATTFKYEHSLEVQR